MIATINGIKVEGTPEEIKKLLDLENNKTAGTSSEAIKDYTEDICSKKYSQSCPYYPYPWWGIYPPYEAIPNWDKETNTEYWYRQPKCTGTGDVDWMHHDTTTSAKVSTNPNSTITAHNVDKPNL